MGKVLRKRWDGASSGRALGQDDITEEAGKVSSDRPRRSGDLQVRPQGHQHCRGQGFKGGPVIASSERYKWLPCRRNQKVSE